MTRTLHNWDLQPLSNLVDTIRQQSRIEKEKLYELWSIPSFTDGKPELIEGKSIGSSKLRVEPNDILISKINPRINRVWIVEDSHLEQLASPEWLVARIKDSNQLEKKFLCYYLSSPEFRDWISQAASSVTGSHSRAKANEILQRNIPLPPLPEQQKIVEILEDHLSRLDAALVDVKEAKLKAVQFRRSLLQTAFTGNLSGDGTGLMMPVTEWKKTKLVKVVDAAWGDTSKTKSSYVESGFTAFSASGPDGFLDYFDYDQEGIVLSAIGANCGKVYFASGKWSCIKNTMRFLIKDEKELSVKFLFYALSNPNAFVRRGSGQPFIRQQDVRDMEISYPPIPEQQKIVEILEDHLSRLDASVAIADAMEKQSSSLQRSLLQAAFTGQLTKEVASV
jgi:restriction endonuclease S subunit